jgi:hypothetical protein
MTENRLLYERYLESQMVRWKADLTNLKARGMGAGSEAMALRAAIEALQVRIDEASYHLSSLKGASDEAWEKVKASTEKNWMEFKTFFQGSTGRSLSGSSMSQEQSGSTAPE